MLLPEKIRQPVRELRKMSWVMTFTLAALLAVGVFFVYSACYISETAGVRSLYERQIIWVAIGLVCYAVLAATDYRHFRRFTWAGYAIALLLLVLVLIVGTQIYGARRWLMFLGVGVQPSELAKFAVVFVLARKLSRPGINLGEPKALLECLLVIALPMGLILAEPDLGTAMVFLPMALAMMFAAGMPVRILAGLCLAGLLGAAVLLTAVFLPPAIGMSETEHAGVLRVFGLSPYHYDRLAVFFGADQDPLGAGWNKRQSEIAVGSGGLTGKGYLKGTQNILGFLPRSVAPTDFIYSVIAEEMGFIGSCALLLLFGVLLLCGFRAAMLAPDKMGRLLCVGFMTLVVSHVFVNMAMTVGLMPITGLPLPFLSYGGSFMMVMMASMGVVQSVRIHAKQPSVVFEQRRLWG